MPEVVASIIEFWYVGVEGNPLRDVVHLSLNAGCFRNLNLCSCQRSQQGSVLCRDGKGKVILRRYLLTWFWEDAGKRLVRDVQERGY